MLEKSENKPVSHLKLVQEQKDQLLKSVTNGYDLCIYQNLNRVESFLLLHGFSTFI